MKEDNIKIESVASIFEAVSQNIQYLSERVSRHSAEQQRSFDKLELKLDKITEKHENDKIVFLEKVHGLERSHNKDTGKMNVKIASMTGLISSVVAVITAWITGNIK